MMNQKFISICKNVGKIKKVIFMLNVLVQRVNVSLKQFQIGTMIIDYPSITATLLNVVILKSIKAYFLMVDSLRQKIARVRWCIFKKWAGELLMMCPHMLF